MVQSTILTIIATIGVISGQCSDSNDNECTYCISQTNFDNGTYRMTSSGTYCLTENISFNPNPSTNPSNPNEQGSWFPRDDDLFPGCVAFQDGSYALGFFAAITIETNDIIFDLNGYKIEYSLQFYLQQRFGSIIEIANQPFLPGAGPADFGSNFAENVDNITIKNGGLGLSSHHGIHSNNASNINLYNLKIYDFEVAGIQLNGFHNAYLQDIDIGPSLQNVLLTGYYSNARFLILALRALLNEINETDLAMPSLSFSYMDDTETVTISEIYENLITSMNYVFRELSGEELTETEKSDELYTKGMDLFNNTKRLPDGSAVYGIVLNSFGLAVNGFGDANNGRNKGENITMENVHIDGLYLSVNEIPAIYFDECDDVDTDEVNIMIGPFGDVMDIRKMINDEDRILIDEYDVLHPDLSDIQYTGNPLSDAQIALVMYGNYTNNGFDYGYGGYLSEYFLNWVLNGDDQIFATCAQFVCNGDIMFHTNKGVIGLRLDHIENAEINGVSITNLENQSPFASDTCSNYSGPHNGGISGTTNGEGGMNTDLRGISISGGDLLISGTNNLISNLNSHYGDTIGIDLLQKAILDFDFDANVNIENIDAATKLTSDEYEYLLEINKTPYPNNFNLCTIQLRGNSSVINAPSGFIYDTDCDLPVFETVSTVFVNFGDDINEDEEEESEGLFGGGVTIDVLVFILLIIFIVGMGVMVYIICFKENEDDAETLSKLRSEDVDVDDNGSGTTVTLNGSGDTLASCDNDINDIDNLGSATLGGIEEEPLTELTPAMMSDQDLL